MVYCAHDREFSEPVIRSFGLAKNVAVRAKYDVESTKTVALYNAIVAEAENPRADVFWNNEILNTIRLKRRGLLEEYRPAAAAAFPDSAKDPDGTWHGFGARARVLLVHRGKLAASGVEGEPGSIMDLTDPRWRGRCAMAKPLFGTTATHAACLYATWGRDRAKAFFEAARDNGVAILGGNRDVANRVNDPDGPIVFGLTDTDDAIVLMTDENNPERERLAIVYPDRGEDGMGTLFLPNTVSIVKGTRRPEAARAFVEYVLSPDVETRLARSAAAQIPLNGSLDLELLVETPRTAKAMEVDFDRAADVFEEAAGDLVRIFGGG